MVDFSHLGGWAAFEKAQRASNSRSVNSVSWAYDEAMDCVLDEMLDGTRSVQNIGPRIHSLIRNRLRKHRRRERLNQDYRLEHQNDAINTTTPEQVAEEDELLGIVRRELTAAEWYLLISLAKGTSYRALADASGTTEGQIRTQAARIRQRLRDMLGCRRQDTN